MKLLCLAHAGGSGSRLSRALARRLGRVSVVALELPGRGHRWREPTHARWPGLRRDLLDQARHHLNGEPYAVLGHSLGALLAYELAIALDATGTLPRPEIVVAAGRHPPHAPPAGPPLADLDDEQLLGVIGQLGGLPARAGGALLRQQFLPALRADLTLAASYRVPSGRHPLSVPLAVLIGRSDPLTTEPVAAGWREYTRSAFTLRPMDGGHFFLTDDPGATAAVLGELLTVAITERDH